MIFFLAVLITAVDILFSNQLGMLAYPPFYDGISYELIAKSIFYRLQAPGVDPAPVISLLLGGTAPSTPLWIALMLGSFLIFGEGEWQAYTVRFWPTLLLLLLLFSVIRRRACATVAWMAVLFTGLLPCISVGLRASGWEYFIGGDAVTWDWYLDDLRPDLLFAVLLLWAVVPLIEQVRNLDRRTWLISGSCGALAILAKSPTTPVLLLAGGVTVIYVLIVNRHRLLATVGTAAWGGVPLAILLTPWLLVGGARMTVMYISHHLTVGRPLWSNPDATFFSEATIYWRFFPHLMGRWEGWLILALALVLWLAATWKERQQRDHRLLAYLMLAGSLYGLVSATPNKNFFQGLSYYLLLWLFSWAALAPILAAFSQRGRIARACLILVSTLYGSVVVGAAFYALHHWPAEKRLGPLENREVTQRIAGDLRSFLTNNETFLWVPVYGYPPALQYYMMDNRGFFPQAAAVDPTTSPPVPQFLQETVSTCKAVLVLEEDIQEVAKYFPVPPLSYPYWRAIPDWVKRPENAYRLARTYKLWGHFPDRAFVVRLYVKIPDVEVTVSDTGWPSRVRFLHGPHATEAYTLPASGPEVLFRSDFETTADLAANRYGQDGGLTFTPSGLLAGDLAGRYESGDSRDHLASPFMTPPTGRSLFFSIWMRPLTNGPPRLSLQDENYAFLGNAQESLKLANGWILLSGWVEETKARQVRLVVIAEPGGACLLDKMLLVEMEPAAGQGRRGTSESKPTRPQAPLSRAIGKQ